MKTNSNSYTITYSIILVLIVAFLLAFVFQALKPMQDANVQLDQQKQILFALNCKVNGEVKYVIPVYGNGLWGPINGFIAINGDKRTVFGAYFNHESETAGLGAEIKDNADWQAKFKGKKLFADDNNQKIALSVEKKIEDPKTQVDAVTGATLTSNGVTEMFHSDKGGLQPYVKFLISK